MVAGIFLLKMRKIFFLLFKLRRLR